MPFLRRSTPFRCCGCRFVIGRGRDCIWPLCWARLLGGPSDRRGWNLYFLLVVPLNQNWQRLPSSQHLNQMLLRCPSLLTPSQPRKYPILLQQCLPSRPLGSISTASASDADGEFLPEGIVCATFRKNSRMYWREAGSYWEDMLAICISRLRNKLRVYMASQTSTWKASPSW